MLIREYFPENVFNVYKEIHSTYPNIHVKTKTKSSKGKNSKFQYFFFHKKLINFKTKNLEKMTYVNFFTKD